MKKIIAVLALAMCFSVAYAQEHLQFKGIPIDGTKAQFEKALKSKGFSFNSTLGVYEGNFAGRDMWVIPQTLDNEDLVFSVMALEDFDHDLTWYVIEGVYNKFKSMLVEKYGKLYDTDENCKRKEDVYLYEKKHVADFVTEQGIIEIALTKSPFSYGNIMFRILYVDFANKQKQEDSAIDDL